MPIREQQIPVEKNLHGHDRCEKALRDCLQNCAEVHRVCLESVQHCLRKGGLLSNPRHIGLLLDCADITQMSMTFIARDSYFQDGMSAFCAEICERCADDCDDLGDDPLMAACAEASRRCAESCRHSGT